ncbi:MAG: plasmid replication protein, CyRepA1 family [Microcystaceae cyanobacterium]
MVTNFLSNRHLQEWANSGVKAELTRLNVKTLMGTSPYEYLCYSEGLERRNDGRLSEKWLKRYRYTELGGWWCSGIDILTGEESEWGCFKPDVPYTYTEYGLGFDPENPKIKRKTVKYEHPAKTATEIFCLKVLEEIWLKIAKRYDIYPYCPLPTQESPKIYESCRRNPESQFWAYVIDSGIPISLTEGAKKAGSLLESGHCAIAVSGIWNGIRQPKDEFGHKIGLPYLIPQLKIFTGGDREINLVFDHDEKWETQKKVRQAIEKTGKLLELSGAKVKVVTWRSGEKGVDDLIVAKGQEYYESVYNNRLNLSEYKLKAFLDLTPYISLNINERYIPESLEIPEATKVIGLRSLHGTGKTEWLANKVQKYLNRGQKVLIIVHREQLARELARRFGIDYRTELRTSETQGVLGYALCIDSLHPYAKPAFNAENWADAVVVMDEVEQVLWHLLNGGTCQKKRTQILKTFKKLLQTVACSELGKIFLADADLSPISINYVEQLIGFKVNRFVVSNSYVPVNNRQLYRFMGKNPSQLIARLENHLFQGKKAIIHTDGQKHKSDWGTRNLESIVKGKFPHLRVLRIDRQSLGDKKNSAYGCIAHLNEVLSDYDVVICSPVIETGVSIESVDFEGVFVISHGVQTVDSVVQTMQRVRGNIPRYIWVKGSSQRIGNGVSDFRSLLRTTHKLANANIAMLQKLGISEVEEMGFYEEDLGGCSPSLVAWGKRACVINHQNSFFAQSVLKKLEALGYQLTIDYEVGEERITEEIKQIKAENYHRHCQEVASAESLTDKEYEILRNKQGLTEEEDSQLEKATMSRLYTTDEVTPELVEKHEEGWFMAIQLHYFLTVGQEYLAEKDRKAVSSLSESDKFEVFKPDFNKVTLGLKVFTLRALQIEQFFDSGAEFTHGKLQDWYKMITTPVMKSQLRAILGINIGEKDTAVGVAQRILKLLGVKLQYNRRERVNGQAVRVYKGVLLTDGREEVFSRWLNQEGEMAA